MITKVEVKDFESHKHTVLEFEKGVNLLRGLSDSGKSSILRAITAVAYNRWNEKALRIGAKTAEVRVDTEKGYVKMVRGSGANDWEVGVLLESGQIEKHNYTKIGKTVPDLVPTVLGMPQVNFAGIHDYPNVMFQLDKHYMLSEIDGKPCSSNMIAQVLDEISGLSGAEELIKEISNDGLSAKKQMTENRTRIEDLEGQLHDKVVLDEKDKKIKKCKQLTKETSSILAKREIAAALAFAWQGNSEKLTSFSEKMRQYVHLDAAQDLYNKRQVTFRVLSRCKSAHQKYTQFSERLLEISKRLANLPEIAAIESKHSELATALDRRRKLKKLREKAKELGMRKGVLVYSAGEAERSLKTAREEFNRLLIENPHCPLCGEKISEKSRLRELTQE